MGVRLEAPYITQLGIGSHAGGKGTDDPTGCWYASVCMVGYFFEYGPRFGVPEIYNMPGSGVPGHQPLSADWQDKLLIQREGLEIVADSDNKKDYTAEELEALLKSKGPILFYWTKTKDGHSYGHASVLTGVEPSKVIYHDPEFRGDGGKNVKMSIGQFNVRRLFKNGVFGLLQRANITEAQLERIKASSQST